MANYTIDIHEYFKNHPFLTGLINKNGILFECYGDAPSPSKDYGQIQIKIDQVIVRWWKITLRNIEGSIYPCEIKNSYEDFYHDELAQHEITRIFGEKTLEYCLNYVCGHIDWISLLPKNLLIKIFSYLNLDDIPQLALVSKLFRSICRQNDLWKLFYIQQYGHGILQNKDLIHLANKRGWRYVFFTNRIKLQMELRREAQLIYQHSHDDEEERERKVAIRRHSFSTSNQSPVHNRADIGVLGDSIA